MVNTEIRLMIFFAAEDGEALYSQHKQERELTVAQIMSSLLQSVSHSVVSDSLRPHGLSMESFRQKYWSRLPFPPSTDVLDPGFRSTSPVLQVGSLPPKPPGKPLCMYVCKYIWAVNLREKWSVPMCVCLHPKTCRQIHMLYNPPVVLFSLSSPNCLSFCLFLFIYLKIWLLLIWWLNRVGHIN